MPAGRPPGSRNKRSALLDERMREKFPHWDPVLQMAEMAQDQDLSADLRLSAAKEVAKYRHPQLRAIEHSGPDGEPIRVETGAVSDAGL